MRVCRCCNQEKPLDCFPKDKRWRGTYKLDCKDCYNTKRRLSYNPEQRREDALKHLYGITKEVLNQMYVNQEGCCAICSSPLSLEVSNTKKGKAHIDHCHTTGKVRGLLCTKCNTLLGMAEDNTTTLYAAIQYLDRSQDD